MSGRLNRCNCGPMCRRSIPATRGTFAHGKRYGKQPEDLGSRIGNERAAKRRWRVVTGVTGRPHARAAFHGGSASRLARHGGCAAHARGVVKTSEPTWCPTAHGPIRRFNFSAAQNSNGWLMIGGAGGQREVSRAAGAFARPNAGRPRHHGPSSSIRALSWAGFAVMCLGPIQAGLFSYFPNASWKAMHCKGTVGTWEHTMSNSQISAPFGGEVLFPSLRAVLGTWEQKRQIPMQENPRACRPLVHHPAGERG